MENATIREERELGWGWEWFAARAHGPHAIFWLVALSFLEPIFLPLFPETLMVAMILAGRERWKKYALITAVSSACGGMVGYGVGAFLFREFGPALLTRYELHQWFHTVQALLHGNVFLLMVLLMFSPIPDKAFVLLAGFLHVPFAPYVLGFFLGRLLRFGAVAYLVHRFGPHILMLVRRYFEVIAAVLLALGAAILLRAFHVYLF